MKSGGLLSENQKAMDVKHYSLDLKIDPHAKVIKGTSSIQFILNDETQFLEIDLHKTYSVSGVSVNGTSLSFERNGHKIFIKTPSIDLDNLNQLEIKYGGCPPVAKRPPWDGGFTGRSQNGDPGLVFHAKRTGHIFGIHVKNIPVIKQIAQRL